MAGLRRFITSYVGLVIGSLVVILVSMNALAVAQTEWQMGRRLSFDLISFAPQNLADYKTQTEARSIVIGFENGVAGGLREAVTSLAASIPAFSQRLIDDARRDDTARASLAAGGGFGLSADAARAVAAQAVASTGLVPPALVGTPPAPPGASPTASPAFAAVIQTSTSAAGAGPAASSTPTAGAQAPTATPVRTATSSPTASRTPESGGGGGTAPTTPPTTPATTPQPGATNTSAPAAPTQSPVAAATQTVAVPTPVSTATPAPAASITATPPPALPPAGTTTPIPRPTDEPEPPTAVPTVTPTQTPIPTATPPEFAMDLSVPGGSTLSFQPIFSGALEFRAGETQSRTVNIQNNGTREFRYYLNTSGGNGLLWTDTTNGLQLTVTRNGTTVYSGPLLMPDRQLGQLARGGQDVLVITVSLPAAADNRYQGRTTTVSYNFTAVALP